MRQHTAKRLASFYILLILGQQYVTFASQVNASTSAKDLKDDQHEITKASDDGKEHAERDLPVGDKTVLQALKEAEAAFKLTQAANKAAMLALEAAKDWHMEAPASANCSAHPGCAALHLQGDCCPALDGSNLRCCSAEDMEANVSKAAKLSEAAAEAAVESSKFLAALKKAEDAVNSTKRADQVAARTSEAAKATGTPHRVFAACGTAVGMAWLYMARCAYQYGLGSGYRGLDGQDRIWPVLFVAAAAYWLVLPVVNIAWGYQATCSGGVPNGAYAVYALFLGLHVGASIYTGRVLGFPATFTGNIMESLPVLGVFTILEHGDMATDSMFAGSAEACSSVITEQWLASWEEVPVIGHAFAQLFRQMHFSGFALALFVVAAYVPQLVGLSSFYTVLAAPAWFGLISVWVLCGWVIGLPAMALSVFMVVYVRGELQWDAFCNFHLQSPASFALYTGVLIAMPKVSEEEDDTRKKLRAADVGATRLVFENIIQLWTQATFFGLTFDLMGDAGKVKALISLALGIGVAATKVGPMFLMFDRKEFSRMAEKSNAAEVILLMLVFVFLTVAPLLLLLLVMAKIIFAFTCPSHVWNVTTGCVEGGSAHLVSV